MARRTEPRYRPLLRVNADYAALIRRSDNSTDNAFYATIYKKPAGLLKACKAAMKLY